jgi:hypothetical protein
MHRFFTRVAGPKGRGKLSALLCFRASRARALRVLDGPRSLPAALSPHLAGRLQVANRKHQLLGAVALPRHVNRLQVD